MAKLWGISSFSSDSIRARRVRISSVTPSEKYSFSALVLLFVKGRTATERLRGVVETWRRLAERR